MIDTILQNFRRHGIRYASGLVLLGSLNCQPAKSTNADLSKSSTVATNTDRYDCENISSDVLCISGYVATQGFGIVEVDIADQRRPMDSQATFADAADFSDRFASTIIIPEIQAQYSARNQSFDQSQWEIGFTPQITRQNFGTGFVVDLQGSQTITADIKNTGKFQISYLQPGSYSLRLFKEFQLNYKHRQNGEIAQDCLAIEYLKELVLDDSTPHLELGAISDFVFYVRPGSKCERTQATGDESDQSATSGNNAQVQSSRTAGGTTTVPTSQPTQTTPAPAKPPILNFSAGIRQYCAPDSLLALLTNAESPNHPWIVNKSGRDLIAQTFDQDSATLPLLGSPVTINGSGDSCLNTAYSPLFINAAAGTHLMTTWNCTGDGQDRYWRGIVSSNGTVVLNNSFLGNSLNYAHCTYSPTVGIYKCGSSLLDTSLNPLQSIAIADAGGGLNAEIATKNGFASIDGTTLRIYDRQANSICTVGLGGTGMGLIEDQNGGVIYAYNGRIAESIQLSNCQKTSLGTTRSGTDAYFTQPPALILTQGRILAAGIVQGVANFDMVILSPRFSLDQSTQIANIEQLWALKTSNGSRIVAAFKKTVSCLELQVSALFQ